MHLALLGVGAIVGTGIYTPVGIGAERAGPAVILSFAIAGLICVCAALAYAELVTMIPVSGSSYTYTYAAIAGVLPLSTIAELANAGTLAAFMTTSASLIVLRLREPDRHRMFRMPLAFFVAPAAILGCCYIFISLPPATQIRSSCG